MRTLTFTVICLIVICQASCVSAQNKSSAPPVKWHPGHYSLVSDEEAPRDKYILGNFLGLQKKYPWKVLEPQMGKYDFSIIKKDLTYLQKHGKRLVLQLQTKDFGQDQRNAPEYLKDASFGGGVYCFPILPGFKRKMELEWVVPILIYTPAG